MRAGSAEEAKAFKNMGKFWKLLKGTYIEDEKQWRESHLSQKVARTTKKAGPDRTAGQEIKNARENHTQGMISLI